MEVMLLVAGLVLIVGAVAYALVTHPGSNAPFVRKDISVRPSIDDELVVTTIDGVRHVKLRHWVEGQERQFIIEPGRQAVRVGPADPEVASVETVDRDALATARTRLEQLLDSVWDRMPAAGDPIDEWLDRSRCGSSVTQESIFDAVFPHQSLHIGPSSIKGASRGNWEFDLHDGEQGPRGSLIVGQVAVARSKEGCEVAHSDEFAQLLTMLFVLLRKELTDLRANVLVRPEAI